MSNNNCLAGIKCPKCNSEGPFFIIATAVFEVHDDGTESYSDVDWDGKSHCRCRECDYAAAVGDFREAAPEVFSEIFAYEVIGEKVLNHEMYPMYQYPYGRGVACPKCGKPVPDAYKTGKHFYTCLNSDCVHAFFIEIEKPLVGDQDDSSETET